MDPYTPNVEVQQQTPDESKKGSIGGIVAIIIIVILLIVAGLYVWGKSLKDSGEYPALENATSTEDISSLEAELDSSVVDIDTDLSEVDNEFQTN